MPTFGTVKYKKVFPVYDHPEQYQEIDIEKQVIINDKYCDGCNYLKKHPISYIPGYMQHKDMHDCCSFTFKEWQSLFFEKDKDGNGVHKTIRPVNCTKELLKYGEKLLEKK